MKSMKESKHAIKVFARPGVWGIDWYMDSP
jgi:hypothetical protein